MMYIRELIEKEMKFYQQAGMKPVMHEFILKHGVEMKGAKFEGKKKWKKKECFCNAAKSFEGQYCEGYALRPDLGLLIHHAWRVKDGKVIDGTWDDPEKCEYFGVIIDDKKLWAELQRLGYYGVLANQMINVEFMKTF